MSNFIPKPITGQEEVKIMPDGIVPDSLSDIVFTDQNLTETISLFDSGNSPQYIVQR